MLAYVGLCFQRSLPYWAYNTNKTYIASTFCENKAKPMMHCDGKCYLKKQLKKADSDASKNETVNESRFEVIANLRITITEPFISVPSTVHPIFISTLHRGFSPAYLGPPPNLI